MTTGHRCRDKGETSIQVVLVFPALLTILFVGAHLAAYARGAQVAGTAATRGVQVAASVDPDADGMWSTLREVDTVVSDLGHRSAAAPRVEVGPRTARVTVSITVERIVPFLPGVVTRAAEMPREVFVRFQDR